MVWHRFASQQTCFNRNRKDIILCALYAVEYILNWSECVSPPLALSVTRTTRIDLMHCARTGLGLVPWTCLVCVCVRSMFNSVPFLYGRRPLDRSFAVLCICRRYTRPPLLRQTKTCCREIFLPSLFDIVFFFLSFYFSFSFYSDAGADAAAAAFFRCISVVAVAVFFCLVLLDVHT